jgi:uncharacterized OB-fold protein
MSAEAKPYTKPLPRPTPESQPFWDSAKEHNLKVQYCPNCNRYQHYPLAVCAKCFGFDLEWRPISGKGIVYTWTTAHQAFNPAFADDIPYASVIVELPEGIRMMTNIVVEKPGGGFELFPPDQLKIGMPVELVYDDVTPEFTLPKWKPAAS